MSKREIAVAAGTGVAAGVGAVIGYQAWKRATERDMVDGRPAELRRLDPTKISADPETFQFKSGGDQKGVTDRLKSVGKWNPVAAGKAMVFERMDGSHVIADGHQRLGLAQRLSSEGQKGIKLDAYVLRERDGWTARDVRAYAAIKNMHESSGQALDMAKVMRERPDLVTKSMPISDQKVQDAKSLAKLSDAAFRAVVGGVVKPEYAAAVGESVNDSHRHEGLIKEMAKAGIGSAQHARLFVGQAMAAPSITEHTGSLFGEETNTRSLLKERAAVLDKALQALKTDKKIFGLLEREAGTIEAVGNKLSHAANVEKAEGAGRTAALIEKLATTRGPVSDMIDRAARAVAEGKKPAAAAREFVKQVGVTLKSGGINALTGSEPRMQEMFGSRPWQRVVTLEDIAAAKEKIKGTSPEAAEKWGKILDAIPSSEGDKKRAGRSKGEALNKGRVQRMEDDMFGGPSTKDKIAAASRAQEAKGRTGDPMNEGLFGSGKLQADLVDMAKQPAGKSDWMAERDQRIEASKAAGAKHLDAFSRSVEGMRGVEFYNVHDPKERGTVRTVANTGEVVINWSDKYSADKNLVSEQVKDGKRKAWQSWLAPTDLKDYVAGTAAEVGAARDANVRVVQDKWLAERGITSLDQVKSMTQPERENLAREWEKTSKPLDRKGPSGWSDAAREASAEARKAEPRGMDGKTRSERAGKAKAIPVIQDHNVPANASTMERFRAAYEATLTEQIKANPGKYSYGVDRVPEMARKMTEALAAGNGDHKGPVASAVAKSLGIKQTIGGIKAALNDQPPPAPKVVEGLTARQMGDAQRAIKAGGPMLKTVDLSQATNAQLVKLDDAALAARRSQTGTGNADWSKISQIENWRDSIRAEARKQTSSVVNDRPTNPNYTPGVGTKQESYWGAKAGPTPTVNELPEGAFKGTQRDFESLSPGMRREIARSAANAAEAQPGIKDADGNTWRKQSGSDAWSVEKPAASGGTLKMMGIPADGSKPFVMAIMDSPGSLAEQQAKAAKNFEQNAKHYTQKLSGYELHDSSGKVVGWSDEARAASAEVRGEKAMAKNPVSEAERAGRINRLRNRAGAGGIEGAAADRFVSENLAKLEALDAKRAAMNKATADVPTIAPAEKFKGTPIPAKAETAIKAYDDAKGSGLRGTQNEANREAIIKNRKANAAPPDSPAGQAARYAKKAGMKAPVFRSAVNDHLAAKGLPALPKNAALDKVGAHLEKHLGGTGAHGLMGDLVQGKFAPPAAKPRSNVDLVRNLQATAMGAKRQVFPDAATGQKTGQPVAEKPATTANPAGQKTGAGKKALGLLAPVAIGAGALIAMNQSAKAGESKVDQLKTGSIEAVKGTGVLAGFAAGTAVVAKGFMKLGMTAAKAAPATQAVLMAGGAIHGAATAKPGERMKGAAKGAWDMSLPGMVVNTGIAVKEAVKSTADRAPVNGRISDQQAKAYASASARFATMRGAAQETDGTAKAKGWSNAARIGAYQARAAKNGFDPTNMPYGGKPENGPDKWQGKKG